MKIRVYVNTGFPGAKHEDVVEVPDDEWNALTEEEKERRLDEEAKDFMGNNIDFGAHVLEGEGDE